LSIKIKNEFENNVVNLLIDGSIVMNLVVEIGTLAYEFDEIMHHFIVGEIIVIIQRIVKFGDVYRMRDIVSYITQKRNYNQCNHRPQKIVATVIRYHRQTK
jgi:hypothetical protein